ncbi:MAG: RibD family protein [Anaerolineales bacterium]|nr:RibD family protein [Anaerolineales bacterium]
MARANRPHITLTYAQSLDGSLTARRGEPLALSGPEAMRMTHQLRAEHDAILVGIGTVLADDPQLNVRLVPGESPQPIILDSQLRFPLSARLMGNSKKPWIVTTPVYSDMDAGRADRAKMLESAGIKVLAVRPDSGGHVSLPDMITELNALGIRTLMVEGGAKVLTAFFRAHLVDEVIITVAPVFVGGVSVLETLLPAPFPRLDVHSVEACGRDWLIRGQLLPVSASFNYAGQK